MSLQIVVLNTAIQPDGSFSVSGVFWLTAPANNIIPNPKAQSAVPFIDCASLAALQFGSIIEQPFATGEYLSGTDISVVQADLQSQFAAAQANIDSTISNVSGIIGTVFDGYAWQTSIPFKNISCVSISPTSTQRMHRWTDWKASYAAKAYKFQYEDIGIIYKIWFYDGPEVHICEIWKSAVPAYIVSGGYTQAQNDSDLSDFQTHFKASGNTQLDPVTKDNRLIVKTSATNRTTNFNLRIMSFYTSKAGSIHNINPVTDADFGDMTLALYQPDGNGGWISATDGYATKTVIDWVPHYNYEIIGGTIDIPAILKDSTTDQWYVSAIGVPDYPPAYGGQVPYISEVNLEAATTNRVDSDGRAVSYMAYNYGGMPNTNKMRFIFKHPAGAQQRFQIYIEHFV